MGADQYGRSILGQIIFGARNAMLVGTSPVLIGLAVGGPGGAYRRYLGGSHRHDPDAAHRRWAASRSS